MRKSSLNAQHSECRMYNVEYRINRIIFCHAICMAFCILCISLSSCTRIEIDEQPLHTCAPIPESVASATAFVANGNAYIFGGRTQNGTIVNSLWQYNPTTNKWTSLGQTPLSPRVNAVAHVVNDTVYIGLGYVKQGSVYADSCYLRDFWQFVPSTQTWKQLANYPISATNGCIAFHTDTVLYVGCGFYANFSAKMYAYSLRNNTWTLLPFISGQRPAPSMAMCGAQTANGRCFIGTGYNLFSNSNWYEFLPTTGGFLAKAELPTQGRDCATATATDDYIYVIGGQHFGGTLTTLHTFDDILRYSPTNDSWTLCGTLPAGALKMISFTIGNRMYFGLGEDTNGKINNQLYYIEE